MCESLPTLWQLPLSHFSEKARWALDHRRIPHRRRSPIPGVHIPIALLLSGGRTATFPILQLDGRTIVDSTALIAALEERYPERPLYPADPELRRRALELEEFFDEELGPHVRHLAFHELGRDRERMIEFVERGMPPPLNRFGAMSAAYARAYTNLRFGVHDEEAAVLARAKIPAALDRIESELGSGGYLVGDAFTVADLTAAALLYPILIPEQGPLPADVQPPEGLRRFREPLEARPGYRWALEMFARHRLPPRSASAAEEAAGLRA